MDNDNQIDRFEEIMRIMYLDQVRTMDSEELQLELSRIQQGNQGTTASDKKELIISRLYTAMLQPSFGQLIQKAMEEKHLQVELLAEKTSLSSAVIGELKSDAVYPNNVPIQLFKKLVIALGLPFSSVKNAVLKTFEELKHQASHGDIAGYIPAYRKGYLRAGNDQARKDQYDDGKELFQNEEALIKYLNRLEELMNQ
jgi:ribosome-binding protein aMBF1 (putative translation factor)